ncbi:MAG TPA: IS4 family transposase [Bacteroidales bacterium]|nr:IS4 family transposase [Bacteroidales bacterium]
MSHYTTILNEMLKLLPRHQFETLVKNQDSDRYVKRFNSWRQLVTMVYAQSSGKQSLRDIQRGLEANSARTYHLGIPAIKRSTLSDANSKRSYKVFEGLFYKLLTRCHEVTPQHRFRFKNPLHSFDATTIDLCLSVFPWAKFRRAKGGIKLHYDFNHAGMIPEFLRVTDAKQHEIKVAKQFFDITPDSIYCMDRGYIDYAWFRRINNAKAFFVTRAKNNLNCRFIGQHSEPNKKGVISDQLIELEGFYSSQDYPHPLRLIQYYDAETDKELVFLTNNMRLSALTIAQIYKARWQIEIFFKWIKQNLKIKTFLGISENAVLTQIWVAMCYYLLLTFIKFQTSYKHSLFYLHRVIQETLLTRCTIIELLKATSIVISRLKRDDPQLTFL